MSGQEYRTKREKVYEFLIVAMCALAFLPALFLACQGIEYSSYSQEEFASHGPIRDSALLHAGLFCISVFMTGIMSWLFKKLDVKKQEKVGLAVLIISALSLLFVFSAYVWLNPYYPEGDQLNTTAGAALCMKGDYQMLRPGGYIAMYQQQKGLMFFYELLFSVFGNFAYGPAKQIHVLLGITSLLCGYFFLKLHTGRALPGVLFCMIFTVCAPFWLYMPYIYGDIPSICLCMAIFFLLSLYEKTGKGQYLVFTALLSGIALLFRMNTWIVLIAVTIGLLLSAWRQGKWKPVLAAVLILAAAEGSVKAVEVMYEVRSGYESDTGIPSILWIAMGLQETEGVPGVYNRYQQATFAEYGFQQKPAAEAGKEYIRARMQEFSQNPEMAADFFRRKLQSQWLDPMFDSLASTRSFEEGKILPAWIQGLYYGNFHNTVWKLSNFSQSIVYLAFAIFIAACLFGKRKAEAACSFWIPLIAVLGGFLFSIIWENSCRYVLPYYVFMLLYVPLGLEKTAGLKNLLGRSQKKG